MHIVKGDPLKSALRLQPARLTASVFGVPTHDKEFVSVTDIFPLVVPKFTVIWLLSGPVAPDVIDEPGGTVHR
jgi:hypothetical protein